MDGIFLGETEGVGALEGVEVGEEGIDEGGGGSATEEKGGLGVFDGEGLLFRERTLGAGVLGFTVKS